MRNRGLLVAGLIALAVSLVGMTTQGPVSGSDGWWPGHMTGYGHMNLWPSDTSSRIEGAQEVTVTATEFAFSPVDLTIDAGVAANLVLVNDGAVPHDLSIPELGVRVVASPGQAATVGMIADLPGTYDFVCTYPGHADLGMAGTLVVRTGG